MIWKFLTQNVLSPKGLNWVQHLVTTIGNDTSAGKILLQEPRLLIMEIGSVSTFVAS